MSSRLLTWNALLGIIAASAGAGTAAILALRRADIGSFAFFSFVVALLVAAATRVSFASTKGGMAAHTELRMFGGPIVYCCFLKLEGRWRWFCCNARQHETLKREAPIDR